MADEVARQKQILSTLILSSGTETESQDSSVSCENEFTSASTEEPFVIGAGDPAPLADENTEHHMNFHAEATLPLQPRMLRTINAIATKEELLSYVLQCHSYLDPINLVTCVYRLARMFSYICIPEQKSQWRQDLLSSPAFLLLLGGIQSHLLQAQLLLLQNSPVKGLDARCVSNLCWALVKLEVADYTESCAMGNEIVQAAAPLVVHFLPHSSSQGLANLLWALAKMVSPPLDTMMVIVIRMTSLLKDPATAPSFDAQALSNSIWALAHIRTKVSEPKAKLEELDGIAGSPGCVMTFLESVANAASALLHSLDISTGKLQRYMAEGEKKFSCQAMVNLVWSFASMLAEECTTNEHIRNMFLDIRHESIIRLHATSSALQQHQVWAHRLPGDLNEQALSNIVYAYDKAGLLDRELLQWIFNVAAFRLDHVELMGSPNFSFKPQELCTLLRAAHTSVAQPWTFLSKLAKALLAKPQIISGWGASERNELNRAFMLLHTFTQPLLQKHHQHQQQHAPLPQNMQPLLQQQLQQHHYHIAAHYTHQQALLSLQQQAKAAGVDACAPSASTQPLYNFVAGGFGQRMHTGAATVPSRALFSMPLDLNGALGYAHSSRRPADFAIDEAGLDYLLAPYRLAGSHPLAPIGPRNKPQDLPRPAHRALVHDQSILSTRHSFSAGLSPRPSYSAELSRQLPAAINSFSFEDRAFMAQELGLVGAAQQLLNLHTSSFSFVGGDHLEDEAMRSSQSDSSYMVNNHIQRSGIVLPLKL